MAFSEKSTNQATSEASEKTELKPEKFTFGCKLDGRGFEVVFPVYNLDKSRIIGEKPQEFPSLNLAQQAIDKARVELTQFTEFKNLSQTFTPYYFSMGISPNGEIKVTTPGLRSFHGDFIIGHSIDTFTTWTEARDFYLQQRETMEKLTHQPILSINKDNQTLSFSDFDSFKPRVAPSAEAKTIPPIAQELIEKSDKSDILTYQNTISVPDWQSQTYEIIEQYLNEINPGILNELKITNLTMLAPKQASELAIQMVIDLTKYNQTYTKATRSTPTPADKSTAMDLLKDGINNRSNSKWSGNGVCRNFASCVKTVFESLKSKQQKYNYLQNTYCLNSEGQETHKAKRKAKNTVDLSEGGGHAWNTFLTVSDTDINAVIVDATWGKRDLETKQIKGVDYTLTRMEETVFDLAKKIDTQDEQFKKIFNFYLLKLEVPSLTGNHSSFEDQKEYYAARLLHIFYNRDVPAFIPEELVAQIGAEFEAIEVLDKYELSSLFKMWQHQHRFRFSTVILQNYLSQITLSHYNSHMLVFRGDGNRETQDKLQNMIFDWLEKNKTDEFLKLLDESPAIRTRYREIKPNNLPKFDPINNIADLNELKNFVDQNKKLNDYSYKFGRNDNPKPADIETLLELPITELRDINPSKFDGILNDMTPYEILKNYDRYWGEISKA